VDVISKKVPLKLKTLYQISESIRIGLSLQEVLNQIVEAVSDITRPDSCLIYLLDETKGELILRASKRPHPKLLGRIKMKLGEGITGWVAKQKKPVAISENASDDPRFKFFHNLPEDRYQAFLSVPILNRDEVIGVINVQHKQAHKHSPDEITLLSTIAYQVGGAIENARLYEETKKKGLQLETLAQISKTIASNRYLKEILQLIVTMTAEMMNSKICSVMFLDEKKQELIIEATQSLSEEYVKKPPLKVGESISGKAVKEKKPVTVLDVTKEPGYKYPQIARKEGTCSMLAVPMMIKDKPIGVINIYTASEHRFAEDEIKVLQSVANQAAVAIENTKLMEEALAAREALEVRKLVERAKGILMKETGMSEDEAYKTIHRKSMDTRKSMREIAEAVILTSEIKK
jgi:signal transduction protein with GAF and PtsI domain